MTIMITVSEWSVNILLLITLVNLFLFSIRGIAVSHEFAKLNQLSNTSSIEYYNYNNFSETNAQNHHNDFYFVFKMIQILVFKYLDVFQTCYLRSINIIYL